MIEEVELINNTGGRRSFRVDQAKALLDYERKKGFKCWTLPEDSNYKLEDGNLIKGSGVGVDQIAEAHEGDTKGKGKKAKASAPHGGTD